MTNDPAIFPKIELVIFDCDGVLIDSEIISARILSAEAEKIGLNLTRDYILHHYVGRSFPKVVADMQANFGEILPADFEANYRARLLYAFERDLRIMPFVESVLARLAVPFCVATSSSPKRVERSLDLTALRGIFGENIYTASQVERGKPAPDLFLFAAKEMGVAPANCLVIEDSVAGVQAGLAAGMQVARFTGGSHILDKSNSAGAHWVFDNFENFFNYYPQLEQK